MLTTIQPAIIIEYASSAEVADAHRYVEELIEYGDDGIAWSIGEICSIRPDARARETQDAFVSRINRLERSIRELQRQAFEAEVQVYASYQRNNGAINECRLTIRWPRRALTIEIPAPTPATAAKRQRGTSHTNRKRDRAA